MTRHTLHDLAAQGHLTRIAEAEYAYLREWGVTHEEACLRVGLDSDKFTATLNKRAARATA